MNNIEKIDFLKKVENLDIELDNFLKLHNLNWNDYDNQICINGVPGKTDDLSYGSGSLARDWNSSYWDNGQLIVPLKENILQESDFTELCDHFYGTVFEEIYKEMKKFFKLGRIRFMRSVPKTCLSWHRDDSMRLHYPITTHEGCLMVYDNSVYHLEKNNWYLADTLKFHTAINSSRRERIHLVASVLEKKY